jgi:hypothetical protein
MPTKLPKFISVQHLAADVARRIQPWRDRLRRKFLVALMLRTMHEMSDDDASHMAAGVAYYALFSLFPLLLGLIAQLRVPIVLVSLAAAMVQYLAIAVFGGDALIPSVHWAPVTLAVVLLVTDPATIPRSGAGRVFFGAGYSVIMIGLSLVLEAQGVSDFFTKVIPIPIVNALVPTFDRWAARFETSWGAWLAPAHNRAHVVAWVVVMCLPWWVVGGKANLFEGRFHPLYATPHVSFAGPAATCEENPVFCTPFSFAGEVSLWIEANPGRGPSAVIKETS